MTLRDIPLVRQHIFVLSVCLIDVVAGTQASARPVKIWSFQELNEQADLVIVGTASATADAKNHSYPNAKDDTWVAIDTQFQVQSVLKGKASNEILSVRHNRFYSKKGELIVDGPAFVEFKPELKHPYLIFLKRTEAGLWEPVTGQHDPFTSFFMLQTYHVTGERQTATKKGE